MFTDDELTRMLAALIQYQYQPRIHALDSDAIAEIERTKAKICAILQRGEQPC